jgi:hypothetical protein
LYQLHQPLGVIRRSDSSRSWTLPTPESNPLRPVAWPSSSSRSSWPAAGTSPCAFRTFERELRHLLEMLARRREGPLHDALGVVQPLLPQLVALLQLERGLVEALHEGVLLAVQDGLQVPQLAEHLVDLRRVRCLEMAIRNAGTSRV